MNRSWRPTLFWLLVIYIGITIGNIIAMTWLRPDSNGLGYLVQLLATLITGALGGAIVRQTGKHKAMDVRENIEIAEIMDDDLN